MSKLLAAPPARAGCSDGTEVVGALCVNDAMSTIYTKNGRPLQRRGDDVFSRSGKYVGKLTGGRLHGPDGRYVGTLDGDRVLYRSTDRATIGSPFAPSPIAGTATAGSASSGLWGDEPNIPD